MRSLGGASGRRSKAQLRQSPYPATAAIVSARAPPVTPARGPRACRPSCQEACQPAEAQTDTALLAGKARRPHERGHGKPTEPDSPVTPDRRLFASSIHDGRLVDRVQIDLFGVPHLVGAAAAVGAAAISERGWRRENFARVPGLVLAKIRWDGFAGDRAGKACSVEWLHRSFRPPASWRPAVVAPQPGHRDVPAHDASSNCSPDSGNGAVSCSL